MGTCVMCRYGMTMDIDERIDVRVDEWIDERSIGDHVLPNLLWHVRGYTLSDTVYIVLVRCVTFRMRS